jgi:hypothetical protein
MSFSDKQNELIKKPVTLVIIKLDSCSEVFGVDPCLAEGTECFNTYRTCTYKAAYAKTTKEYRYVNTNASITTIALLNAKPFLEVAEYLPTELLDDKTIPSRANLTFADVPDNDIGIDPYITERAISQLNVGGTHFKKLIERNPYIRKRTAEVYEGYEGLALEDFELRYVGKINSFSRGNGTAKIGCIDNIKALESVKYPIKLNAKITEDLGAITKVESEEKMLQLPALNGDYALRTDFLFIKVEQTLGTNGYLDQDYYYRVVAFDVNGNPIASSNEIMFAYENPYDEFTLDWDAVDNASYYRIYGRDDFTKYIQTTETTFTDDGDFEFTTDGTPPVEAYRIMQLSGTDPADLQAWNPIATAINLGIDDTSLLDSSGYIRIEDEAIYYASKDADSINNIKRLQGNTKGARHYEGTNIQAIFSKAPGNPFTHLMSMLTVAGYSATDYEKTKLEAYRDAYTGINFSYLPNFKDTDFGKIVFDMVRMLNGKLWVNELGKIDFKYITDNTVSHTITDATNIVKNSSSVEYNLEDLKTRIILTYNKTEADDKTKYDNAHVEIYVDAEGANEQNEVNAEPLTTDWINNDCGTQTAITTFLSTLCNSRLAKRRTPRPSFSFDVELKDSSIKVGQLVYLNTDEFTNYDGTDYTNKIFEVIKKDPKENNITLTVQLWDVDAITTTTEEQVQIYNNPKPINNVIATLVKVTNLKYIDENDDEYTADDLSQYVGDRFKFKFDNMYASSEETATDITGVERQLPLITLLPTYLQVVDTTQWQTTKRYYVYMFVATAGEKFPVTKRPTVDDANGKWYLIATLPDKKINDEDYKYIFSKVIDTSYTGLYVSFDIYADTTLHYDANAPVGINIEAVT